MATAEDNAQQLFGTLKIRAATRKWRRWRRHLRRSCRTSNNGKNIWRCTFATRTRWTTATYPVAYQINFLRRSSQNARTAAAAEGVGWGDRVAVGNPRRGVTDRVRTRCETPPCSQRRFRKLSSVFLQCAPSSLLFSRLLAWGGRHQPHLWARPPSTIVKRTVFRTRWRTRPRRAPCRQKSESEVGLTGICSCLWPGYRCRSRGQRRAFKIKLEVSAADELRRKREMDCV